MKQWLQALQTLASRGREGALLLDICAEAPHEDSMNGHVKTGTIGEQRFVVEVQHTIQFEREGMPGILSTPSLIWFLEHAARNALALVLEPGEISVGVVVHVEHLAATPLGGEVICRARVVYAKGGLISFQLEAHDEQEQIARGSHKRRVIQAARLAQKVNSKRR